jgi:Fe-S-cluster containining protein
LRYEYPTHIRYSCERCALCCGDTDQKVRRILILESEADDISKRTQMNIEKFTESYDKYKPYSYQIKKIENGKCIFLRDKACSIYEFRPLICRFYPFRLDFKKDAYVFNCTNECPGIGKGKILKKDFFKKLFDHFTAKIV